MEVIESFFTELDARWVPQGIEPLRLQIIGSAALMLQADFERGTKDSDIIKTEQLSGETGRMLSDITGEGSRMHRRHQMYLDQVPAGLPYLPRPPKWHPLVNLNRTLTHFDLEALDVVDVVVSKLRRFHPADQSDIEAMIDLGLVQHGKLVDRFLSAFESFLIDARAPDLPKITGNLNRVERDMFGVDETEIEFPEWL